MANATSGRRPAARPFTDSGLERSFTKGEVPDVDDGTYENYVAAGLIEKPADQKPEAEKPATKSTGKAD